MKEFFLLFLLTVASVVHAADTSRNPNRWPSLGLTLGGNRSLGAHQENSLLNRAADVSARARNASVTAEGLLPLTNRWTLLTALGGVFAKNRTDEGASFSGNHLRADLLIAQIGATYFFGDHGIAPMQETSDSRPSLSLLLSGNWSVGSEFNAVTNGIDQAFDDPSIQNYSVLAVAGFPIETWALNLGAGGVLEKSVSDETATSAGSTLGAHGVQAFIGLRHYFVTQSLYRRDTKLNPDRWPSAGIQSTSYFSVDGEQEISLGTFHAERGTRARRHQVLGDLRYPLSNHWTLRVGFGSQWNRTSTDEAPNLAGTVAKSFSLTGVMGFRYYFSHLQ